jgi:hypothetical protein
MKPFTNDTYGRNHYFSGPKEHKVPKSAGSRAGTRSGARQALRRRLAQDISTNCFL